MEEETGPEELMGIGTEKDVLQEDMQAFPKYREVVYETASGPLRLWHAGREKGPVLLFLSDLGLTPDICFNSFCSQPGAQALFSRFTVLFYVQSGLTPEVTGAESTRVLGLDELADALYEVLSQQLAVTSIICFGAGLGGNVGLRLKLRHPKLFISGLVLVGAPIKQASWLSWLIYQGVSTEASLTRTFSPTLQDYLLSFYFSPTTVENSIDRINSIKSYFRNKANASIILQQLKLAFKRDSLLTRLSKELDGQFLLLAGNHSVYLQDLTESIAHLRPDCVSFVKEYDCGTLFHEERPRDALVAFVLFLQGLGYHIQI